MDVNQSGPSVPSAEAERLKALISGGVDVKGDLVKRLNVGDQATVKFLSSMYPSSSPLVNADIVRPVCDEPQAEQCDLPENNGASFVFVFVCASFHRSSTLPVFLPSVHPPFLTSFLSASLPSP
jgi:hypothetical protein